jgi:hypothetical protein
MIPLFLSLSLSSVWEIVIRLVLAGVSACKLSLTIILIFLICRNDSLNGNLLGHPVTVILCWGQLRMGPRPVTHVLNFTAWSRQQR